MLTYHFQQTNSILPADFYVIYWKFHPTRLLKPTRLLERLESTLRQSHYLEVVQGDIFIFMEQKM